MTTDVLQEPEVCFICLESEAAGPLHSPCACPRKVHPYCLARWQLQCAGKEEVREAWWNMGDGLSAGQLQLRHSTQSRG
jgi:hypothetical protein